MGETSRSKRPGKRPQRFCGLSSPPRRAGQAPAFCLGALSALWQAGCWDAPDDDSEQVVVNVSSLTDSIDLAEIFFAQPQPDGTPAKPLIQFKYIPDVGVNPTFDARARSFTLGGVPIGAPGPDITAEAVHEAIRTSAGLADCYVIRQRIDWEALRPGGTGIPGFTQNTVALLDNARQSGFRQTMVELDPIGDRHHLGPLPPAIAGADLGSNDVREALRREALIIAEQARPDYFSFAVEINGYYESNPADFENFVSLHHELYDEVKALSPETKVMASFNLEAIQGLLRGLNEFSDHAPQWFLIDMFEPKIDVVAFSTLPFPIFYRPVQLPDDYISRIQQHTKRPIALAEVGWTSATEAFSTEQLQVDYVALMARQALQLHRLELMAWTILYDAGPGSIFDSFPAFRDLGLLAADGRPKPALNVWKRLYGIPLSGRTP